MIYLGIDPGATGGIAAIDSSGAIVSVAATPDSDEEVFTGLYELARNADFDDEAIVAVLEHVWSRPGQGHGGAFKFGVSFGRLRMALQANRIPFDLVVPRKWQAALGVIYRKGFTDTQKKNIAKARAQQLFPGITVTHATADALLIAEYCRRLRTHHHGEEDRCEEDREDAREQERATKTASGHGPSAPRQARRPLHVDRRRA